MCPLIVTSLHPVLPQQRRYVVMAHAKRSRSVCHGQTPNACCRAHALIWLTGLVMTPLETEMSVTKTSRAAVGFDDQRQTTFEATLYEQLCNYCQASFKRNTPQVKVSRLPKVNGYLYQTQCSIPLILSKVHLQKP